MYKVGMSVLRACVESSHGLQDAVIPREGTGNNSIPKGVSQGRWPVTKTCARHLNRDEPVICTVAQRTGTPVCSLL